MPPLTTAVPTLHSPTVDITPRTPSAPPALRSDKSPWSRILDGVRSGMTLREALGLVDLTRADVRRLLTERSAELVGARATCIDISLRDLRGLAQGNRGSWQAATYIIERQSMRELELEIEDTVLRCTPDEERGQVLDNARRRLPTYFKRPGER